jgi:L,D-transpeptidase ErfK/SrfK
MKRYCCILILLLLLCHGTEAKPEVFPLAGDNSVIGSAISYKLTEGDSLIELARKFDLGYNEIAAANPGLDPFIPDKKSPVVIPTSWVLPDVRTGHGIVINLSELRLYLFYKEGKTRFVRTFPIGIGIEGNDTPTGQFTVTQKIIQPSWHVPKSIQQERPYLPRVVEPGPENPLGSHAMRLSLPGILIHGTNKPWGVGRRVSHGCIRLYPEDIEALFNSVKKGHKVTILRQPVKAGLSGGRIYLEVHGEDANSDLELLWDAESLLTKKRLLERVDTDKLNSAIQEKKGMPVDISQ